MRNTVFLRISTFSAKLYFVFILFNNPLPPAVNKDFLGISAFSTKFYFVFTLFIRIHRRLRKTDFYIFRKILFWVYVYLLTICRCLWKTRISTFSAKFYIVFILFINNPAPAENEDFLWISAFSAKLYLEVCLKYA